MSIRRIVLGGGFLLAVLIGLTLVAAVLWPAINDVTTGETPEYADLRPQRFKQSYERVFDAALATAQGLGWEVAPLDRGRGEIRAVATTRVFRFKDDVIVTLRREGDGVVVNVRSRSRIGRGDLGANARRIRQFQAELAGRI